MVHRDAIRGASATTRPNCTDSVSPGAGQKRRMGNLINESRDGASSSTQRAGLFDVYRSLEHEHFPTLL